MNTRPKHRDERRRSRSFTSSFTSLEGRSLLSALVTAGGTINLGQLDGQGPSSEEGSTLSQPQPQPTLPQGQGLRRFDHLEGGAMQPTPPRGYATAPNDQQDKPPSDWSQARGLIEFDSATIAINGTPTREFAFANQATGMVSVVVGRQFHSISGIAQPKAIALKDITGDGRPDLIVADSGDNRVLIFPGLADGAFGPEAGGGSGFAVGTGPTGITVGDVTGDGQKSLIVTNGGSDNVSVLVSHETDGRWSLGPQSLVGLGPANPDPASPPARPVMTLIADIGGDGVPDLIVLEAGADQIAVYKGLGHGKFSPEPVSVYPVGTDPTDMLLGRFDHRPGLDLVTVNSGSNDLTFISGIATSQPSTLTISSGGTGPDSAVAVDLAHDGTLDLVVANGGDGRVALLQSGNVGMQLAGVVSRADLPSPTAIAAGSETANGFDLYAATAGQDAAAILHFDLGAASNFLAIPLAGLSPVSEADTGLFAQLLSTGESPMDLAAILVNGLDESELMIEHGPGSKSALFTKTEGQGLDQGAPNQAATTNSSSTEVKPLASPAPEDPTSWARYVLGLDTALATPGAILEAVAESDAIEMRADRPPLNALARSSRFETRPEADLEAFDAALRSLWSDVEVSTATAPEVPTIPPLLPSGASLAPEPAELPTTNEAHSEMIPMISGFLLASRLILKATRTSSNVAWTITPVAPIKSRCG